MIKISDKIWYVIKPEHEDNLAYMCGYEETKEGNPTSSVSKMQSTGRGWARIGAVTNYKELEGGKSWEYEKDVKGKLIVASVTPAKEGTESIADNIPTTGFSIGDSVSRWSTDNKLFRVKDPRGFTVEVPTGNIATLLHHTTVVKGIVQEECVWGREGNSHILLPVNSEPYLITLDQMDTLDNKLISIKDLKVGDWVKFFNDDNEYYYAGKMRGTWSLRGTRQNYSYPYYSKTQDICSESVEVKDDKWTELFLYKYSWSKDGDKWATSSSSKPKIVQVLRNEKMEIEAKNISIYCPERVKNKSGLNDGDWHYVQGELVSIEFKEK
ncbi:MAG: hypothetical protein ACRCVU_11790 [Flavobacterium sp.]